MKWLIPIGIVAGLICANAWMFVANIIHSREFPTTAPVFHTAEAFVLPLSQPNYLPLRDERDGGPNLDAKAAIVYDVKSDRDLFARNPDEKLPIASLTKILNAVVVWERFSPNEIATVQPTAVKVDGERQDLFVGETISINSLLRLMLIESSNDAAYALRDYAQTQGIDLIAEMNAKAAALGMTSTHIVDAAGLDDSGYSTAHDLIKIVSYGLRYDALWNFSRERTAVVASADGSIAHEIKSTNELLGKLADIFGGKTGYTDSALGCIMLIVQAPEADDKIIAIVLGSTGRFEAMSQLVAWTKQAYRWQ
ncbi:MAG TPA: serine hydrolase [Candidatus Paceibacterota bacterium]|nr:serine hydrolase [Candidatus Paceibacterota bacterium]